jgi:hypothetical protein
MDSSPEKIVYTPAEFAKLFGKSQTWGYRQLYAGRVTAITQYGRTLIPASEVERILTEAGIYEGNDPRGQGRAEPRKRQEPVNDAEKAVDWLSSIRNRRGTGENPGRLAAKRKAAE